MHHQEVARRLIAAGYSAREIHSVWSYAWNEQHIPISGKKRKPKAALILEEIGISPLEIEFDPGMNFSTLSNYF